MAVDPVFLQLLQRIRQGDANAAYELVRSYESVIRVAVRSRLRDPAISRVLDSMDICQSVMASFFPRAALGEYALEEPKQLVGLLIKMAQNKLNYQLRQHRALKRDIKKVVSVDDSQAPELPGQGPTASQVAEAQELLEAVKQRFSAEEMAIAELRQLGCTWDEIAQQMGGTPDARRKQFGRAVQAAGDQLDMDQNGSI